MQIKPFYMDKYPVTNAEFKKFLDATHYHPKDSLNFLKDWKDGTYPDGWANKPVTWVSIEDARAYAKWAGKAASSRVGVAVRRAGQRRARLSLGELRLACPGPECGPSGARWTDPKEPCSDAGQGPR